VRQALFEGVRDALAEAAEGRPLLLLLDDLHAAEPTSLELLHFLLRQAAALRLVVVATCREDAVRAGTHLQVALAHLDTERLARGLHVPRLSLAGTREQLGDLLDAVPAEALAAAVHRATDGRPSCVEAVVAAWRETGLVAEDPQAAVRAVVASLPESSLSWLAAGAVLGRRFDPALAAGMSGLPPAEADAAEVAALEVGLVEETGDGLRFHGAMAHEAVRGTLARAALADLHGAAAGVIEAAGAQAGADARHELVAWHATRGPSPARAVPSLLAAGHRAAAVGALHEAAGHLEGALELAGRSGQPLGAARREALDALGLVRLGLGEIPALQRAVEAAVEPTGGEPAPPERRARARRWGALALVALGEVAQALALTEAGLEDAGADEADEAAPLLHLRSQLLWHAGRFEEAREVARRCAAAGERLGDADLAARGGDLAALAEGLLGAAPAPPTDRVDEAARRRQDRAPQHPFDVHAVLWERDLLCGWTAGRLLQAARLHGARAAARDAQDAVATSLLGQGQALLLSGQAAEAEPLLRRSVALHRASGCGLGEALALDRLGGSLAARGEHDEALEVLSEGVVAAERGALRRHALCRLHATLAAAWLGAHDAHAAEAAARVAAEELERHGPCLVCEAALRKQLLRIALALGRLEDAGVEARALQVLAVRRGGPLLLGEAALSGARVRAALGHQGEARAAFAEALRHFSAAGAAGKAGRAAALERRWYGAAAVPVTAGGG